MPSEEPFWTPDAALIARIEAGLRMQPGSESKVHFELSQYDRYYYGATGRGGFRIVRGVLIMPPNREDHPKTGVHITEKKYLPQLHGGGCAHVYVFYNAEKDFSSAQCDEIESDAPPSEQPHFKPDEQTAAQMEAVIQDKMHRAALKDLSSYSRYYAGITLDGKAMIRARIEQTGDVNSPPAGVHLVSEPEDVPMLFDGGCGNITAMYDVKAAKFTELFCDGRGGFGVLKP